MGFSRDAEDEIRECASQIAAVGDLLLRSDEVPQDTMANCGWLVRSLEERIEGRLTSPSVGN